MRFFEFFTSFKFLKFLKKFRSRRGKIYSCLFSAESLCLAGLLMMPALLFNPSTPLRVLQFFFFWFLAWLSGRKNNPLITLLIILTITAFNLAVPYGRVLFSIGIFRVTSGSLEAGIRRGVTLEALVMLSRFSIRPALSLPGGFGKLIGESFRMLALIMERKGKISRKHFIEDLDRLMLDLSGEGEGALFPAPEITSSETGTRSGAGFVILGIIVILSWLPRLLG